MVDVQNWLFDLDDTLYPASSELFPQVSRRITNYIGKTLSLDFDAARALQRRYWLQYGTSMRGMVIHHEMDPEPFLKYVHDVPIETFLSADARLRALLLRLPGRRFVFTNSPGEYAARVLAALGVGDLFDTVFDIRHSGFLPKPDPAAYDHVMAALGRPASGTVMVDDAPQNLSAASAWGITTVWLRSPDSVIGGVRGGSIELGQTLTPADVVIECLDDLEESLQSFLTPNSEIKKKRVKVMSRTSCPEEVQYHLEKSRQGRGQRRYETIGAYAIMINYSAPYSGDVEPGKKKSETEKPTPTKDQGARR